MRHRAVCLAAGVALLFFPALANAGDSGWFVEAGAGQANYIGTGDTLDPTLSKDNTDLGFRLGGGYRFNRYLAVEAAYANFGQIASKGSILYGCVPPNGCLYAYAVNAELKAHAWTLSVAGSYPFGNGWSVFARAGATHARSHVHAHFTPLSLATNPEQPYDENPSSTEWDATFGIGVTWSFAAHWATRLSWDEYRSLGSGADWPTYNIYFAALDVVYRF